MRDWSRGAATSAAALEDRPASADLRGAISRRAEGGSLRRSGAKEQARCASLSGGGGGGDVFVGEEEVPSLLSFKGGRGGTVSKATSLM
jgi:hypothetical protein